MSGSFGFDRGTPIDRYYIEQFLTRHRADIRGRVLEVGDRLYADKFGSETDIESVDIIDVDRTNARATLVVDLGADDRQLDALRFD